MEATILLTTLCVGAIYADDELETAYRKVNRICRGFIPAELQPEFKSPSKGYIKVRSQFFEEFLQKCSNPFDFIRDKPFTYGRRILPAIVNHIVFSAKEADLPNVIHRLTGLPDCELRARLGVIIAGGYEDVTPRHDMITKCVFAMLQNEKLSSEVAAGFFAHLLVIDPLNPSAGFRRFPEIGKWARVQALSNQGQYLWYVNLLTTISGAPWDNEWQQHVIRILKDTNVDERSFDGICVGLAARLRFPALKCPKLSAKAAEEIGRALLPRVEEAMQADSPFTSYWWIASGYHTAGDLPLLLAKVCGGETGKSLEEAFFTKGPLDQVLTWTTQYLSKTDMEKTALAHVDKVFKRVVNAWETSQSSGDSDVPINCQRDFFQAYFSMPKISEAEKKANRQLLLEAMTISLEKEIERKRE